MTTFLTDSHTENMREQARTIFNAGVRAADPEAAVRRHCRRQGDLFQVGEEAHDLARVDHLWVVGAGKATAAMARAIEMLVGDRIDDGWISVKYGHGLPLQRIGVTEAGHPLPDAAGMAAARRILALVKRAGPRDLVLVLLSGGGSALLPLPAAGLTLSDKQAVTQALLDRGAAIGEINAVRKHLSAIKGGRLAQVGAAGAIITLVLSDVVGDELESIASGPTVPDSSTFADCLEIIRRYGMDAALPAAVADHLAAGAAGHRAETPKSGTHVWTHTRHCIIGNNLQSIEAAAGEARRLGYAPLILSSRIEGDTRCAAHLHAAIAREVLASGHPLPAPVCLLSGGETTVTVRGTGKGGRNQEFALAAALAIDGARRTVVLSAGTDGGDGPTDAAGAIVDHASARRARDRGLDPRAYLDNNDSYTFFKRSGELLITGPTRTNVMDLHVVLIQSA
jgi:hydroxypyruvate reductase